MENFFTEFIFHINHIFREMVHSMYNFFRNLPFKRFFATLLFKTFKAYTHDKKMQSSTNDKYIWMEKQTANSPWVWVISGRSRRCRRIPNNAL